MNALGNAAECPRGWRSRRKRATSGSRATISASGVPSHNGSNAGGAAAAAPGRLWPLELPLLLLLLLPMPLPVPLPAPRSVSLVIRSTLASSCCWRSLMRDRRAASANASVDGGGGGDDDGDDGDDDGDDNDDDAAVV